MDAQLQPLTKAGQRFVDLAEEHAADAAARADAHDRDGTFPMETFQAMKESGFLAAPVPEDLGGSGLTSPHDLGVGMNRLGRGDGSTAIAANMHLSFAIVGGRVLRGAREAGDEAQIELAEGLLRLLGTGTVVMANATEAGTDIRHPLTEIKPVDGGYSVTGRKIFGTLSPVADMFWVPGRVPQPDGSYMGGAAIVFRGSPGQDIGDNWDALGMRGSGSNDIVYDNCFIPESLFLPGGTWGEDDFLSLEVATAGNIGLVASFLGIAEAARDAVVEMARTRRKAPSGRAIAERGGIQHLVAEMEADLATCRALLDRAGRLMDAELAERPVADVTLDDMHALNKEFQCAKLVVNRKAIEVVDRALTVSGGAGYLTGSPLSRLYRDVRAGPFMQPLSPNEAYEYIGKVALGLAPTIET